VVYFPLSTVSPNDFYRGLLYGLGEIPKTKKIDMFGQIQASILTLYKNQKITPVIVLDEMHLASNAFLDDISLLFNFYIDSENPFNNIISHALIYSAANNLKSLDEEAVFAACDDLAL